jgi:hypothetical protein
LKGSFPSIPSSPSVPSNASSVTVAQSIAAMVKHGDHEYLCSEEKRLKEDRERKKYWKKWGPYLSE